MPGPGDDLQFVHIENAGTKVSVLPMCGGKITSLVSASGRDWLWHDPYRPIRQPVPDACFADFDLSGWDECFPTIAPCPYPGSPAIQLSDHGELWSRPWEVISSSATSLTLRRAGQALPYVFERTITVGSSGTVGLGYSLTNQGSGDLTWMWSAHPLFAVQEGMRVHLAPAQVMTKEFGIGGRIGPDSADGAGERLEEYRWSHVTGADGVERDLSIVEFPEPPVTDKVVVRGLEVGRAELCHPSGETLRLEWWCHEIPFLGLCSNLGAWPFGDHPGRWVALEPTTGSTDRLDEAAARGEAAVLGARATTTWQLTVAFGQCPQQHGLWKSHSLNDMSAQDR